MVAPVDSGERVQGSGSRKKIPNGAPTWHASLLAGEGGFASYSPLPVGLSNGVIQTEHRTVGFGTCLPPEFRSLLKIFRGHLLREEPAGWRSGPRLGWNRGCGNPPETCWSWGVPDIGSPIQRAKPIFVGGGQPHIGVMTDNPRVEKVNKVGIPFGDGKTRFCLE